MRGRVGLTAGLMLRAALVPVILLLVLEGCGLSELDREYVADGGVVALDGRAPLRDGAETGPLPGETGASDGCGQPENCTNGVDDDCDGLVDCADPECMSQGFTCTASDVPMGWTLTAFSPMTRPLCPPSYGAGGEQAVVSAVDAGPAGCDCACSGTPATCQGTAIYIGYPNSCVTGTSVNLGVADGACGTVGATITSGDSYELNFQSSVHNQPGTCTGSGQMMGTAPAPTFNAGATCAVASSVGGGCSGGVCAPPTGVAFQACIVHPGQTACPTFGFTQQILASTGTPGYVDTRSCGSCTCATPSLNCGSVSNVALFTNGTCAGGATVNVNPGCQLVNQSASIGSYKVSFSGSSAGGSCQPSGAGPPPTGGVSLDTAVETICCAP